MAPRLSEFQKSCNLEDWLRTLNEFQGLAQSSKDIFLNELRHKRHVIIVDMRQFFTDAIKADQIDSDFPYVIVTRGAPFALLDSYPEISDVTNFCETVGLTWELHVYPSVSQSVH